MKSLLIGNGAREHALAEQMCKSSELYAFMGAKNPGIAKLSKEFALGKTTNPEEVLKFALHVKPDYVFIGPENPIAAGVTDTLQKNGIKVCSPDKTAGKLEYSKSFCRSLMQEYVKEGCPKFEICSTRQEVLKALEAFDTEIVVKPSGLTGGKGVKVQGKQLKDLYEVREYALEVVDKAIGGSSEVVLEEKLEGEEFTLQVFTDGEKIYSMPLVQDHKHAFENDIGPMTGGMGSYSDSNYFLPFVSEKDAEDALSIMEKTLSALKKETSAVYKGVLYGQFILTKTGPKVIEYNVRFGDPEAVNVLPLLETDFSEICMSILDESLIKPEFKKLASVCKYFVPKGYPEKPESGAEIKIDEEQILSNGAKLHYAAVEERDGKIYTSSSRAFTITGYAETIEEAEKISQKAISNVNTEKLFYRKDIGTKELIEKRIKHMEQLRSN